MLGRVSAVVLLALAALPACNREGPEDAAIAAPGAGIPVGAVGAVGADFDPPPAARGEAGNAGALPRRKHPKTPIPPDPFAEPPSTAAPRTPPTRKGTPL